jgi:hypothetical protein
VTADTDRRIDRIQVLLEWYIDLLYGWDDGAGDGSFGVRLPRAELRHTSYLELERLLPLLSAAEPEAYWHLAERYWRAPWSIVLRCPRCVPRPTSRDSIEAQHAYLRRHPSDKTPSGPRIVPGRKRPTHQRWHTHSGKAVQMRPVRVICPSSAVEPSEVARALVWLDEHWQGPADLPEFGLREAA